MHFCQIKPFWKDLCFLFKLSMQKLPYVIKFLIFVLRNHIFSKLSSLNTPKFCELRIFLGVKFQLKPMMIMANSISTLQTCTWMWTCKGAKKSQAAQRAKNWPEAFGNASLLVWWEERDSEEKCLLKMVT